MSDHLTRQQRLLLAAQQAEQAPEQNPTIIDSQPIPTLHDPIPQDETAEPHIYDGPGETPNHGGTDETDFIPLEKTTEPEDRAIPEEPLADRSPSYYTPDTSAATRGKYLVRRIVLLGFPLFFLALLLMFFHHTTPVTVRPNNPAQLAMMRARIKEIQEKARLANAKPKPATALVSNPTTGSATIAGNTTPPITMPPPATKTISPWNNPPPTPPKIQPTNNPFKTPETETAKLKANATQLAAVVPTPIKPSLGKIATTIENEEQPTPTIVPAAPKPKVLTTYHLKAATPTSVIVVHNNIDKTYRIGATAPTLGTIEKIETWNGTWELLTTKGIIRP